jgi:thiamine-monophosphate kinase
MTLTVSALGEAELLNRILPRLAPAREAVVGPGDDAAVIAAPDARVVLSIDTLVQDRDFRLAWPNGYRSTGYDVGWKAAAQNLSDINAMGARATSMVVSITLPPATAVAWLEDFADGMTAALRELGAGGCGIAGGDLGAGSEIAATVAVTGTLDGGAPVLRSGARDGDVVALAGTAGRAAAGLALLESLHPMQQLEADLAALVENQCRPRPPLAAGPAGAAAGARAMLDVSDGLVRDAGRLALAGSVAVDLCPEAVSRLAGPLRAAAERTCGSTAKAQRQAERWVLGGGEDYGLLAVFGQNVMLPDGFTAVGSIVAGRPRVTVGSQAPADVGWDHFAD